MIALKGHYDGKVIVPDEPVDLPTGEPLIITLKLIRKPKKSKRKSVLEWMEENAVADDGFPPDLAHEHDHYLYGTPKKGKPKA
jgi:hypothetical protein